MPELFFIYYFLDYFGKIIILLDLLFLALKKD